MRLVQCTTWHVLIAERAGWLVAARGGVDLAQHALTMLSGHHGQAVASGDEVAAFRLASAARRLFGLLIDHLRSQLPEDGAKTIGEIVRHRAYELGFGHLCEAE